MGIDNHLKIIKEGVFGRDVRQAIHDGIQQVYDDATANGNANMEVAKARGEFENLADRLENILSEAQQGKIPMDRLTQDVKEAMTGGAVAVVGRNAILSENIVNRSVDWTKTNFIEPEEQFFDASHQNNESDKLLVESGRTVPVANYSTSHEIYAVGQLTASFIRAYVIYNGDGSVHQYYNTNNNLATVTVNLTSGQYIRFSFASANKNQIMINKGSFLLPLKSFSLKLKDEIKIGSANDTESIGQIIAQVGNQLFDSTKITKDKLLLENDGRSISQSNYFVSDAMQIQRNGKVTLSNIRSYVVKDNLGRLKTGANTGNNKAIVTIDVAEGDVLLISGHISELGNVMVNYGDKALPFESYRYVLKDDFYIPKSRIIDDVPEETAFSVTKSGQTISIRSRSGNDTFVQNISLNGSRNRTLNILDATLNGEVIHNLNDEITPIRLESTVGANHGYTRDVLPDEFHSQLSGNDLFPSVKDIKQEIVETSDRLTITETYDILDLQSIIANGVLYKNNLSAVESAVRVVTAYEFYGFGNCKISTTLAFLKDKRITTIGFLQSVPIIGDVTRYIPGLKPFDGFDFSAGVNLADYNINYNVETKDLLEFGKPPLFYRDSSEMVDYSMGYLPVELAKDDTRLQKTSTFWDLRGTKKSYPVALNWKSNPIQAGTVFQLTGFRAYKPSSSDGVYLHSVDFGNEIYLYIHTKDASNFVSKQAAVPIGSKFEVVRIQGIDFKSETIGAAGIVFSSKANSYAILKIVK